MGRAKGMQRAITGVAASRHDAFTAIVGDDRGNGSDRGPDAPVSVLQMPSAYTGTPADVSERHYYIGDLPRDENRLTSDQKNVVEAYVDEMARKDVGGLVQAHVNFVNDFVQTLGINDPAAFSSFDATRQYIADDVSRHYGNGLTSSEADSIMLNGGRAGVDASFAAITGTNNPQARERFAKQLIGP